MRWFSKALLLLLLLGPVSGQSYLCPGLCLSSAGYGPNSSTGGPVIQPLRSAVSRALVGQSFVTGLAGTAVQGQSRMRMYLGDAPLTELRVCYGNWAGQTETAGSGNIVIEAAIEMDGPVGVARALFSGSNTVTIAARATACSDAVLPSSFGLTTFPADAAIWFRTGITVLVSTNFPQGNAASAFGEGMWAGPAFTSQVNATGAMTTPAGGAAASGMTSPIAVLGRYTVPMPTLCDIGDSISAGVNDSALAQPQGFLAGNGYVGRAGYNTYGTHIYPTFKLGIGGDAATPGGYDQRATFFQYCTHGLTGWGVNDIAGSSPATVFANLVTAWALMKSDGIQFIYSALVTPKTSSTDSWATEANQTYFGFPGSTIFSPGGNKDQLNVLINASVGSNNLTGVVNFLSVVQGVDPDKWVTPNATSDGLHPLGVIHAAMAPFLTTAVQSVGPQLPTPDNSWVPTGADWAADFKNGRYYQVNCPALMCWPTQGANSGTARTSAAYGVTANDSTGTLIQFGPNTPRITPGRGLLAEKAATNLFTTPFAPATQTVTVSNATQYTISVVGTGSLALTGACTGSVVAGTPVTCTTSTTSLTATVSGTLLSAQVETGAVATTPISGTRSAEEVGLPNGATFINNFGTTAGTMVLYTEKTPPNVAPLFAAFGNNYMFQATTSTINMNTTTVLTATCAAGANGHTGTGITWDGTGRALDCNGGTIASDANATGAGAGAQVYIGGKGSGGGDSTLNSYVQMMVHYPIRLTGATTPTFQQATSPTPVTNPNCPQGTALVDGCTGAQTNGTIVDAHLADAKQVIDLNIVGGSGYTPGTYTWTTVGGGGSGATGTVTVSAGGLLGGGSTGSAGGFTISNQGSGYTSRPTIAVPVGAGVGTGGSITPTVYQLTAHNCTSVTACNSAVTANWNVAGVDYPVGLDTTLTLADPTTAGLPSGATFSGSTVTLAGSGGVFNGYDFTLHNTKLNVTVSGWTITNNSFICGPHNTAVGPMITFGASVASATMMFNNLNGGDTIGGSVCDTTTIATIINSSQKGTASFVFEYNLCFNFDAKCLNFQGGSGGGALTITEKYNYYYNIGLAGSTHGESEYAFFGAPVFTMAWELGFNTAVQRFYVSSSNATAPLAQEADGYALTTNMHHNYVLARGNQSYTGASNSNAQPNSAPIYLGEQNETNTGTLTGTATNNIIDYSGSFFPYNTSPRSGASRGTVADFNAGTGNTCTVTAATNNGTTTCN